MIARVEPLTTTRRLSGPFDYALPEEPLEVGSVVRVPFGHQALDGVVVGLADTSELAPERLVAPSAVREDSVPPELVELALWMAAEYASTPARALSLVLPPKGKPRTRLWAQRTPATLDGERLSERQRALLDRLPGLAGEDLAALRRLERRGLVELTAQARRRAPLTRAVADREVELTGEQAAALEALQAGGAFLLHGVTGSGKTEVYLRATAEALERGEGVIVLVPEIALTPQTVSRFQARFGDTVALLHSALGEGERYDEWRRLRSGEARIAVGPRSAVFAPVADLGLIVIDEEHDASYKHEGDPRYDARRVAARARADGGRAAAGRLGDAAARELAGDAPAAADRARRRPAAAARADPRHARRPASAAPRDAAWRWPRPRKSIVLLNRRGWSNFLTCRSCGKAWECPQCDVALVLHRAGDFLACHHCGHREPVPQRCDACGSLSVARHGAGTERIEHELREALDVPVFRLDADTAGAKDAVGELLRALRRGARRAAARDPDGGQGPRLPRRHARRRARRRLDAALPRLPRRGADLRADRPARRARRAAGRGAATCSCRPALPTRPRSWPPRTTTPRASSPASSAAARRCATRRSPT